MDSLIVQIAPIAAVGALWVVGPVIVDTYRRVRGVKTVTCPESGTSADVELDVAEATASAAVGPPHLVVTRCSRWSETHSCDQECITQL